MTFRPQWWGTLEKVAAFFSGITNLGCLRLYHFFKKLYITGLYWHVSVESRKIRIYLQGSCLLLQASFQQLVFIKIIVTKSYIPQSIN